MENKYAAAFNQWMDDFTNSPEKFRSITETAMEHLRMRLDGREPTYGESCAVTFKAYLDGLK